MTARFKEGVKKNSGMTMVETLVAFTLLIIISLSFLAILHFSSRMTMEADDRRAIAQELDEKLARQDTTFTAVSATVKLKGKTEEIPLDQCEMYSFTYPESGDAAVTVVRFKYKEAVTP